ncbi:MAG TPA: hypothetical protein DGR97_12940 [Gammaproteobacteria bacterium]|nr:hypothetical protein [Gammaproteobacteria bacterium]|tara:strand:+ start:299 stop:718 length:420 start_codon:yes stop_codon:yes gene_type:complete
MRSLAELETRLESIIVGEGEKTSAGELLKCGEEILERWIEAKEGNPTTDKYEGFRLLALQRQGARGDASFNACRETCRELVYHFNLLSNMNSNSKDTTSCLQMMTLVTNHLVLFVGGKIQQAGLGEFCCSAKPLHEKEL